MDITIEARLLARAMSRVIHAVDRHGQIPILSHVILTLRESLLHIRGTNLDQQIESCEPVLKMDASGSAVVPAQTLLGLANKFPKDGHIRIATDEEEKMVRISCGRSRTTLPILSSLDMPELEAVQTNTKFSIPANAIAQAVGRLEFAISRDETRFYLNGIFMHEHEGFLYFVATDGHKLGKLCIPTPEGAVGMPGIIVPRDSCKLISDMAKAYKDKDIDFAVTAQRISVSSGFTSMITKMIDGTFPNYNAVIPGDGETTIVVSRSEMIEQIELLSALDEGHTAVSITVRPDEDDLLLEIKNSLNNTGMTTAEAIVTGNQVRIGISVGYMLLVLKSMDDGAIRMDMKDPSSPVLIRNMGEGGPRPETTMVVMPMMLP